MKRCYTDRMTRTENTPTNGIATPSTEELESAWFELMAGDLGLDRDPAAREFFQAMLDHMRTDGMQVMERDGEPLDAVSSAEVAKRMCAAYACLFYGA